MNLLYSSLNEAGLIFEGDTDQGEANFILLETYEDGTIHSVDVDTFETLFGDVEENPTYEALSGSHTFKLGDTQYTMTADEMGYQKYFDQWKRQWII
ncbi:hypothetical protein [Priestia filamentosa]|uniref:hypothetical protein n=1 Tax=Priestia filamentosa TaxID=1402861 RepID=UPI000E714692|nr:hypothetical protein [Priestia filamentosa]RJS63326.1 hypothetical protein CJ485_00735 [Priestia filamentosa]